MQGGHIGTHGHEGVPIPEVETGRGVPGVDLWLGGGGGWFSFGVGFGAGDLLIRVGTGGFSVCIFGFGAHTDVTAQEYVGGPLIRPQ